jgi:dTDP-4-amino-4,6-dideoxygalactose transaminase
MIEYENLRKSNAPFFPEYRENFESVLNSGWFVLGQQVKTFEEDFARYCGTKYCVGTANGLDALTLALRALEFRPGSEVIVPSNTYIATILSVLNCNLTPVLVEPDIATYNIDPALVQKAITKKTAAILVVHLYGKCCQMDIIEDIARKHDLKIVEDCAQAHGAMFKNKRAGTFGDYSAFSFYPTKNLGALGDGGSLNTNSADLNVIARKLRNYGSEKKYFNDIVGVNSRLDEMQAAFLNVKLKRLDEINSHKRRLASLYQKHLKDDFIKPQTHDDFFDVFHIYNVRHPRRDELKEYLLGNGIGCEIHYPVPPNKQKAMAGILDNYSCPIADEIHKTTISLPISFFHTDEDILNVIEEMNSF